MAQIDGQIAQEARTAERILRVEETEPVSRIRQRTCMALAALPQLADIAIIRRRLSGQG